MRFLPNSKKAVAVLLEALYSSDRQAAAKFGVCERTVRNWRERLAVDPEFAALFWQKKRKVDESWEVELPECLIRAIRTLSECTAAISASPEKMTDPNVIHALVGAIKICAEIQLTAKVLNARSDQQNRSETQVPGDLYPGAGANSYPN